MGFTGSVTIIQLVLRQEDTKMSVEENRRVKVKLKEKVDGECKGLDEGEHAEKNEGYNEDEDNE